MMNIPFFNEIEYAKYTHAIEARNFSNDIF